MIDKSIEQLIEECGDKLDVMLYTDRWQVGKFGYYSFKAKTLEEALKKLADYDDTNQPRR